MFACTWVKRNTLSKSSHQTWNVLGVGDCCSKVTGTCMCRTETSRGSPVGGYWNSPRKKSPVGAHAANGHVEGAIRRVATEIRRLKDAAEFKYKVLISNRQFLMSYAANHAADLITRFGCGKDGRTAWELARGKQYRRILLPFWECCMYMLVRGRWGRAAKMDRRWRKGIFVGILKGSDEAIVMTPEGARTARPIRRVVEEQRYDQELLNQAVGVPWDDEIDGLGGEPSVILPAGVDARPVQWRPHHATRSSRVKTICPQNSVHHQRCTHEIQIHNRMQSVWAQCKAGGRHEYHTQLNVEPGWRRPWQETNDTQKG